MRRIRRSTGNRGSVSEREGAPTKSRWSQLMSVTLEDVGDLLASVWLSVAYFEQCWETRKVLRQKKIACLVSWSLNSFARGAFSRMYSFSFTYNMHAYNCKRPSVMFACNYQMYYVHVRGKGGHTFIISPLLCDLNNSLFQKMLYITNSGFWNEFLG